MDLTEKRYIVGIDLGTTNSAVAYIEILPETGEKQPIRVFHVPQLTGQSEIGRLAVLPSFLYIPGKYDISEKTIQLPWATESDNFVGRLPETRG